VKRCSACHQPLSATLIQRKADRCLRCRKAQPGRPDTTGRLSAKRTPPIVLGRTLGQGQGRIKHKPTLAQQMWIAPRAGRPKGAASHGSWWAEPVYQQDRAAFMVKAESLFPSESAADTMQLAEWIA